jgi:uncharacterized membrane protein (DUF2068 family)
MHATPKPQDKKSDWAIVAIGLFKLVKSVSLLALGIALVHWRHEDLGKVAARWLKDAWLARPHVDRVLIKLSLMRKETIDEFAIGSFVYSALLLVEGVGLCLRKRWAEFLTVGITASLLPFEFYELYRRVTVSGIVVTVVNIAILVYLIVRLFKDRRHKSKWGKSPIPLGD